MQRNENIAYFSISGFDVRYQRPFLLLSSPDQRLLLFLLLLLILFSALIAQSSLTMTLMLMRRLERVVLMSCRIHQRSSGGWEGCVEGGEVVMGVTGEGTGSTETSKHGPHSRDCFSPAVTPRHTTRQRGASKEIANYGDIQGEM